VTQFDAIIDAAVSVVAEPKAQQRQALSGNLMLRVASVANQSVTPKSSRETQTIV